MNDALIRAQDELYGSWQQLARREPLPRPFTREIKLLSCHIAGTSYRDVEQIEPLLAIGETLNLRREPDNRFDPLAVALYDPRGAHLGYVPRHKNEALANLLDAGKFLRARLTAKTWREGWLKLETDIYLQEL